MATWKIHSSFIDPNRGLEVYGLSRYSTPDAHQGDCSAGVFIGPPGEFGFVEFSNPIGLAGDPRVIANACLEFAAAVVSRGNLSVAVSVCPYGISRVTLGSGFREDAEAYFRVSLPAPAAKVAP